MSIIELPPSCRYKEPKYYKVKLHECITCKGTTSGNDARKNTYENVEKTLTSWGSKIYLIKKCRYCEKDAKMIDASFPYLKEYTACEDHAKELFGVIIEV